MSDDLSIYCYFQVNFKGNEIILKLFHNYAAIGLLKDMKWGMNTQILCVSKRNNLKKKSNKLVLLHMILTKRI